MNDSDVLSNSPQQATRRYADARLSGKSRSADEDLALESI